MQNSALFGAAGYGTIIFGRPYLLIPSSIFTTPSGGAGDKSKEDEYRHKRKKEEEKHYLSRRKRKKILQQQRVEKLQAATQLPVSVIKQYDDHIGVYAPMVQPINLMAEINKQKELLAKHQQLVDDDEIFFLAL